MPSKRESSNYSEDQERYKENAERIAKASELAFVLCVEARHVLVPNDII